MLGADVKELSALARDFSVQSLRLRQAQQFIDGAVNQLPRHWQGSDAQRFPARWRSQHRGLIARNAAMPDETASELNKNASEQEQAGSVAGLGGAPRMEAATVAAPWTEALTRRRRGRQGSSLHPTGRQRGRQRRFAVPRRLGHLQHDQAHTKHAG